MIYNKESGEMMNITRCPHCYEELIFVDYVLKGGVRVEAAEELGKTQTVFDAVEYHCPYCEQEIPKKLLKRTM